MSFPADPSALCTLLGIDSSCQCFGQTKLRARCKKNISKDNRLRITRLLNEAVAKGSLKAASSLLDQISRLVMCQQYHQFQAPARLHTWEKALEILEAHSFKTEEEDEKPDLTTRQAQSIKSRPASRPSPVQKQVKSEVKTDNPGIKREDEAPSVKSSIPKTPKSSTPSKARPSKPVSQKHDFEPYGRHRSTYELNMGVKRLILRTLTPQEKLSRGCNYVYVFPENYHDPAPYLKIGNTNNLEARTASWSKQCGYVPLVLSYHHSDNYVKVERLVHTQLWNHRLRERGCPGCGVKHKEWFNVRSNKASAVISLWTEWMRLKPYDENGVLKAGWLRQAERVDLDDPNCWETFVQGKHGRHSEKNGVDDEDDYDEETDSETLGDSDSEFLGDSGSEFSSEHEFLSCDSESEDDGEK